MHGLCGLQKYTTSVLKALLVFAKVLRVGAAWSVWPQRVSKRLPGTTREQLLVSCGTLPGTTNTSGLPGFFWEAKMPTSGAYSCWWASLLSVRTQHNLAWSVPKPSEVAGNNTSRLLSSARKAGHGWENVENHCSRVIVNRRFYHTISSITFMAN